MATTAINRRKLLQMVSAAALFAGAHVLRIAPASAATKHELRDVLAKFLDRYFIAPAMQCGARIGDGVPPHEDVVAFMAEIKTRAASGPDRLQAYLRDARRQDFAGDRMMVIDGWVLARTEVLAASAYILLTGKDCGLQKSASL